MTVADEDMRKAVAERRRQIRDDAPCEGCGCTLASCEAERGKDPAAPWFGCCAGVLMTPCRHRPDTDALSRLLKEVETGHVRTLDEMLLDSVSPFSYARRRLARMLATWTDPETDYYGE